ncbi:mitochondrial import inner membrane translocase subunit TIM8-like [Cornus florida]|uniref:mitochondrial import inner membrane translocase subunit TIM8-like n=1 Tax=Cornus florida TaxID=4283 RepID=UPI002898FE90|nr:mitochondrial import inner membrane translocase subunit TIM8-like [Cornus florida]
MVVVMILSEKGVIRVSSFVTVAEVIPPLQGRKQEGFLQTITEEVTAMDSSKRNSAELQQLLEQEKKTALLNQMVAKVTKECWDKCITGTPGSKFSSSESACLSNCARRYMDTSITIMKRLQSMR